MKNARRDTANERTAKGPIAKVLSILIVISLIIGTVSAVNSLSVSIIDEPKIRFVYQNIANTAGFMSIVLLLILSAVQRGVYSIRRNKEIKLDERQVKERQEVFELSYKIGAVVVLAALWLFRHYSDNIYRIMQLGGFVPGSDFFYAHGYHLPIAFYWPLINAAVTLLALPLIVAAWRKR